MLYDLTNINDSRMEYSLVEPYERKARSIEESLGGLDMIKAGTPTERVVIKMRMDGAPYARIQSALGMIPKRTISMILKENAPELVSIDANNHKIPDDLHKDYD